MKKITRLPSGAKIYKKKLSVHAYLTRDGATYYKEWGQQEMDGEHMVIIGPSHHPGFDVYGCAVKEFNEMYEPTGAPNEYRKNSTIEAVKMDEPFTLETVVDSRVEVKAHGNKGDYVIRQVGGELQVVPEEEFKILFEEVGRKTVPKLPSSTFTF